MDSQILMGFVCIILGAVCGGSFALPSKFAGEDTPWETLWGPFFFFVTILIPLTLFPFIAGGLFRSVGQAGMTAILGPLLFGMLWGLGSMTLGLSFAFIGLSLAYAINYGAQITFGTMMPMVINSREDILTSHGYVIMSGVLVCLVGVVVVGRAGILKSRSVAEASEDTGEGEGKKGATGVKMLNGLILAFASGILCACYAVAFGFGGTVMEVSQGEPFGNPVWRSTFVVTALVLWGGSVTSCLFCVYKFAKNKSWGTLAGPGIMRVLLVAFVMACLHDGAILFWGVGASKIGALGVSVGYGVFMSLAIIVGNINGFLTGEWRGAGKQSRTWIVAGILILIAGVCVMAKGNAMKQSLAEAPEEVAMILPQHDAGTMVSQEQR